MPWLQVNILAGREEAALRELMAGLSRTTAETLDVPIDTVRVVINEVPPKRWGVAGVPIDEYRS